MTSQINYFIHNFEKNTKEKIALSLTQHACRPYVCIYISIICDGRKVVGHFI